ncbi:FUSC family protein [Escherichia coli]
MVKFGLMVQISDSWQFLLFLFPLLATMQLLKLQMPKFAALWGQLIVFMVLFIAVTNPPVYDFADFLNDNLANRWRCAGLASVRHLRPCFRCRKPPPYSRRCAWNSVDQLSRAIQHSSESEFESLTYHHVSQLSNSAMGAGLPLVITLGVVPPEPFSCRRQLRDWESRS